MRSQFSLSCVLGSAIFISQLTLNIPVEAEQRTSFATSGEIEQYAIDTVEHIRQTALTILTIPSDDQTFENTVEPWNRLCIQLARDLDELDVLSQRDGSFSETVSQVSDGLRAYLLEVARNPELRQAFVNCCLSNAQSPEFDPFERDWENHRKREMFIARKFREDPYKMLLVKSHRDRNDDRGGSSYEGGITGKWGDGNGIHWEGYVQGEAHDRDGNYVEGRVTQKDDGTGEVDVHGGHESKNK
jgi:hypothetical protein